jgi:hypothetical protein
MPPYGRSQHRAVPESRPGVSRRPAYGLHVLRHQRRQLSGSGSVLETWERIECMNALIVAVKRLSVVLNAADQESGSWDFKSASAKNAPEWEIALVLPAEGRGSFKNRHNQTDPNHMRDERIVLPTVGAAHRALGRLGGVFCGQLDIGRCVASVNDLLTIAA